MTEARRDLDLFAEALVDDLRIAHARQVEGCARDEVWAVRESAGDFLLPEHFVAFLERMGRGAGRLFQGTDVYYPGPAEANEYAREFSENDDPLLTLENRFFFAHHQGYQWYYFDSSSPGAVFMHTEGTAKSQLLAEDFLTFLWQGAREAAAAMKYSAFSAGDR